MTRPRYDSPLHVQKGQCVSLKTNKQTYKQSHKTIGSVYSFNSTRKQGKESGFFATVPGFGSPGSLPPPSASGCLLSTFKGQRDLPGMRAAV